MKKLKDIVSSLLYIVFIVLIIIFTFKYKIYFIASGSMEPTLKTNELIVVKNSDKNSVYEVGDIITFYDEDFCADVTHRIIEKNEKGYHTKGDYNNVKDFNIVTKDKVIGKVVFNSFLLGFILINYKYQVFAILIFFLILFNIIFFHYKDLKEEARE